MKTNINVWVTLLIVAVWVVNAWSNSNQPKLDADENLLGSARRTEL